MKLSNLSEVNSLVETLTSLRNGRVVISNLPDDRAEPFTVDVEPGIEGLVSLVRAMVSKDTLMAMLSAEIKVVEKKLRTLRINPDA